MTKTLHGKVHGKTIELDEDPGIAEGQEVEVQMKVVVRSARKTREGFLRTEGALADDTEWDAIMEEIHQARKLERRPQIPIWGNHELLARHRYMLGPHAEAGAIGPSVHSIHGANGNLQCHAGRIVCRCVQALTGSAVVDADRRSVARS